MHSSNNKQQSSTHMQNTIAFIAQHSDELHDVISDSYNGKLHAEVSDYVKGVGAEGKVSVEYIALDLCNSELGNYYDDAHAGGGRMNEFFEQVGYNGCNDYDVFEGDTDEVLNTEAYTRYILECISEWTGVDAGAQWVFEQERLAAL